MENDTDKESDKLNISVVNNPLHGSVQVEQDKIVYTPSTDYYGSDRFEYSINDGEFSDSAFVDITIEQQTQTNNPPKANEDEVTTAYNTSITIDVLANDIDENKDTLSIIKIEDSRNAQIRVVNNKIEYTPNSNFSGIDKFYYTISDEFGITDESKVIVTVEEKPNSLPVAKNDDITTGYETSISIDVLSNDLDDS